MDNIYYFMVQNNSVQPIIVRQPSAIIIHTQPKFPITLDLPSQNIILKNDEPQPIIVRQQNPNIIIQKEQNEFHNNPNFTIRLNENMNNMKTINDTNIIDNGINENINEINTTNHFGNVDSSFLYNNNNIAYANKITPINNMHFNNGTLNNQNYHAPYNAIPYVNDNTAYINHN